MTDGSTLENITNASSTSYSNGIPSITTSGTPHLIFDVPDDMAIDSSKYRYFTMYMLVDKPWTVEAARVYWGDDGAEFNTETLTSYRGWHTYTLDLGTAKGGTRPKPWLSQSEWPGFQVNLNSTISIAPVTFHIDHILLTAVNQANTIGCTNDL